MARILLVDDEPAILKSVARILSGSGHEVQTATCRDDLALIDCTSLDVVVMDIDLGDDDGVALAAEMAQRGDVDAILFHTANTNDDTLARAAALGVVMPKGELGPLWQRLQGAGQGEQERDGERRPRRTSGVVRKVDTALAG